MKRRVVITGAGVVSSIGIGVDEFWRHCLQGKTVLAPIPELWLRYSDPHSRIWSPLPEYYPESFGITRIEGLQLDPVSMPAIGAAREAIEHAGFSISPGEDRSRNFVLSGTDAARTGVYFGTGIGGAQTFLHSHAYHTHLRAYTILKSYTEERNTPEDRETLEGVLTLIAPGPRYNPFVVPMLMPNAQSAAVGIKFSITGPNKPYCVDCASGTVAIGNAYRAVRDNYADVAITGGSEYLHDKHGHIFRIFDVPGTLVRDCKDPEAANRPFDARRSGFLFAEGGAAALVIEELEHAQKRGATIMAELTGYAETFDAHSMMSLAPGGQQIERMIRAALDDAGVSPDDGDYINAHGTGTKNNDETEAEVINRVFGKKVRINSTKSLLGHTIGASGAIEALVTALSLRDGMTHVCKNLETPLSDLNFVHSTERFDPQIAISHSFAFGGHNAAIAMRCFGNN